MEYIGKLRERCNCMRKVGIIGSFCDRLDGQTIKTKILYDELKSKTDWKFYIVNTQAEGQSRIGLLVKSIDMMLKCKDIFILVSQNGARVYFPMLYYASKLLGRRVYHDVIGGSPEDYVINNVKNRKYLNKFAVNWVETEKMVKGLESVGVHNAEVLPNFKRLRIVDCEKREFYDQISFCTFSRVMKEKGIEEAISAIETINKERKDCKLNLDIYGYIDDGYAERFKNVMEHISEAIQYKGMVPYEQSVEFIKEYYALLFPTFWFGEGFPGTIVDSFASGVPVIASDWSANSEIITDGVTGIIYPNGNAKSLKEAIEWSIEHSELMEEMRKNCLEEAKLYQPEAHIQHIIEKVELNR